MQKNICRWGIMGTAGIARKNWQAIRNSGNGRLMAIASRDQSRAQAYIDACQAQIAHPVKPRAEGTYEALIEAPDIDALYIPLPTGLRKEWVIRAAKAGKHVLCEKPCGSTVADLEEMVAACRESGVQFMDGVMFMHGTRLARLRETLDDGTSLGRLKRVASQFSFLAPPEFFGGNIRTDHQLEPLGCLGDLGWYNIRFTLWALGYEMPLLVTGRLLDQTADGVPTEFSGELLFSSGVSASFYCSFVTEHQQWVNLSGTKGNVQLDDFVLPWYGCETTYRISNAHFELNECEFHMERHVHTVATREYANSHATSQETALFRRFGDLVLSGKPDSHWPNIALQTQRVMEACLLSARRGGQETAP